MNADLAAFMVSFFGTLVGMLAGYLNHKPKTPIVDNEEERARRELENYVKGLEQ